MKMKNKISKKNKNNKYVNIMFKIINVQNIAQMDIHIHQKVTFVLIHVIIFMLIIIIVIVLINVNKFNISNNQIIIIKYNVQNIV